MLMRPGSDGECRKTPSRRGRCILADAAPRAGATQDAGSGLLLTWCRNEPKVQAMIREQIGAVGEHGGDRKGKNQDRNANLMCERSDTATYAIARLKRDRPDLADACDDVVSLLRRLATAW